MAFSILAPWEIGTRQRAKSKKAYEYVHSCATARILHVLVFPRPALRRPACCKRALPSLLATSPVPVPVPASAKAARWPAPSRSI